MGDFAKSGTKRRHKRRTTRIPGRGRKFLASVCARGIPPIIDNDNNAITIIYNSVTIITTIDNDNKSFSIIAVIEDGDNNNAIIVRR